MHETISMLPKERIPKKFTYFKKQHLLFSTGQDFRVSKQTEYRVYPSTFQITFFLKVKKQKKKRTQEDKKNGNRDRT